MATTTNYSWSTPDDTALVKDGAAAIRSLGTAIDTTVFNNAGAAIAKTIVDAKGDIIAATAADTVARLAVGANASVLTADSSTATGLKWATPAGGGKVLQVVQGTYATETTVASTTMTDTGLTASITPTLDTSKVLVLVTQSTAALRDNNSNGMSLRLLRGATSIYEPVAGGYEPYMTNISLFTTQSSLYSAVLQTMSYLDSPATTSSTTYKTQQKAADTSNSGTSKTNLGGGTSTIILLEIGA
jgi:hypothetical protein